MPSQSQCNPGTRMQQMRKSPWHVRHSCPGPNFPLQSQSFLHQSGAPGESGATSPLSNFHWHSALFASGESGERGATLQLPSRGTFLHQSYHFDQVLLVNQLPHYHIPTIKSLICHITLIVSCCNFFAFDQLSSFFSSCTVYIVQ